MRGVRAVFFDADGTLFQSPEEIFAGALRELGYPYPPAEVRRAYEAVRPWYHEHLRRYQGRLDDLWTAFNGQVLRALGMEDGGALAAAIHRVFERLGDTRLHPDVTETLAALRDAGLVLGVITNRRREPLGRMLRLTGIEGFFGPVATMDDYGAFKPDVRLFLLALARAGVRPAEAVHAGDVYGEDVLGARAAGMRPVLLQRDGAGAPPAGCEAIGTLAALPALVLSGVR
ncbi:MAG TPA: HAD-IA family hydrolase [Dehalococcoidia bacterium]